MLKTIRRTMTWLVGILLVLLVLAGIGTWQIWSRSDELLHQAVMNGLRKWAPDLKVQLGRCRLDWLGQVRLEQFSLTQPGAIEPLISLPEVLIDLDREALIRRQEFLVENVRIVRPRLEVIREADGTWCFQKLPKLPAGGSGSLPGIQIEQAQVVVHWWNPGAGKPADLHLDGINVKLMPNGRRHLLVEGTTKIDRIGQVVLEGRIGIDSRTGTLTGKLSGLEIGRDLLQVIAGIEPAVATRVAELEQRLRSQMLQEPDPLSRSPFSIAGIARGEPASRIPPPQSAIRADSSSASTPGKDSRHQIPVSWIGAENSILGLQALVDISFRLSLTEESSTPDLRLLVDINQGDITNTALPFPLSDLSGQVECTSDSVLIRRLTAANGDTQVEITGDLNRTASGPRGRLNVKLTGVACDERLRSRLSYGFGRIYDAHHPTGTLDIETSIASNPAGQWTPRTLTVTARKCSVTHELFPCLVSDAVGTIRLDGTDFVIDMLGRVSDRPVSLKGRVQNPGPNASMAFEIATDNLPVDHRFLAACPPNLQKTLISMQLQGLTSGRLLLTKSGAGTPMRMQLSANLHNARMKLAGFPYAVDQLSGHLEFDGQTWHFSQLLGRHGTASISAQGQYDPRNGQKRLTLDVSTSNAPLDEALYTALPEHLRHLWNEFGLRGRIKNCITHVEWLPDQPPRISLSEFHLTDSRIRMRLFPYEFLGVDLSGSFADGKVQIHSFQGRHGKTVVRTKGLATIAPNGDWHARLEPSTVSGLLPDAELHAALGPSLKSVFSSFDPAHRIDLTGMLELKGTSDPRLPITAAWDIATDISGSTLDIGILCHDAHGRIESRGLWDGQSVRVEGQVGLSTVMVLEHYRITDLRGPFRIRDGILTAGSAEALQPASAEASIPIDRQLSAKFIGGLALMNAQATLNSPSRFLLRLTLGHGSLERYAQQYMTSRERLQGVMNGWVLLTGKGSETSQLRGQGQLQVSPAALYELPVIFQVLSTLSAAPQDNAAFEYARVDFNIADNAFAFSAIDLVGQALQLRGRGTAGFDGRLDLKFVSLPTQTKPANGLRIPLVTEVAGLVGGVTSLAGVVVEVSGTVSNPRTRIIPSTALDEAFRRFIENLSPQPLTPPALPRTPGLP